MLLTGTFFRSIDDKQRIAIPKKLRSAFSPDEKTVLYVAPGTDGSLALYDETSFAQLGRQLADVSPTGQNVRAFSRLFYARAQSVEIDGQGRIRIPPDLVELAKLQKEVVLVGVRDHMEIWDRQRWAGYTSEKQPHFDEIAEQAFTPTDG